jgi:hypothetical protein
MIVSLHCANDQSAISGSEASALSVRSLCQVSGFLTSLETTALCSYRAIFLVGERPWGGDRVALEISGDLHSYETVARKSRT